MCLTHSLFVPSFFQFIQIEKIILLPFAASYGYSIIKDKKHSHSVEPKEVFMKLYKPILYLLIILIMKSAHQIDAFDISPVLKRRIAYSFITSGAISFFYTVAYYQSLSHKTFMILSTYALLASGHQILSSISNNNTQKKVLS